MASLKKVRSHTETAENSFAGRRATMRVPGTLQKAWLEPLSERRDTGCGRPEEQQGSAGQGLAGRCKDFGFSLQTSENHGSVLSRGGRGLAFILPTEGNPVTR